MKQLLILLTALTLTTTACKKDDDQPGNFQTPLPPATQTGAGTFACYVNGKPFIDTSGNFNCYYQLVDGEYYFGISGKNKNYKGSETPWSLKILSKNKKFHSKISEEIGNKEDGKIYGVIAFSTSQTSSKFITTDSINKGKITITKFDEKNQIVSGLFEITITHPVNNSIVKITNGRFDSYFSK